MSEFTEIYNHTRQLNARVKKFCAPLFNHFGFNAFFYHYIGDNGFGTSFGSHVDSFEYYYSNQLYLVNPYARHPKFFESGVHLISDIAKSDYRETIDFEAGAFNLDYRLVILRKVAEGCHGFSFATAKESCSNSYLINHIPFLQLFIDRFLEEFSAVMRKVLQDQVSVEHYMGKLFYQPFFDAAFSEHEKKKAFLQELKIINPYDDLDFSKRERECITYLLLGHSANEIARQLNLSKRTVEHYIDNVKIKVNCLNKQDLIEKCQAIQTAGLL